MKISLNWLKDFIEINKTPEELASLLSLHTLEVEMVTKVGDDFVLDIDVTPNRGDCLSHVGIAREISAIITSIIARSEVLSVARRQATKQSRFTKKTNIYCEPRLLCQSSAQSGGLLAMTTRITTAQHLTKNAR